MFASYQACLSAASPICSFVDIAMSRRFFSAAAVSAAGESKEKERNVGRQQSNGGTLGEEHTSRQFERDNEYCKHCGRRFEACLHSIALFSPS